MLIICLTGWRTFSLIFVHPSQAHRIFILSLFSLSQTIQAPGVFILFHAYSLTADKLWKEDFYIFTHKHPPLLLFYLVFMLCICYVHVCSYVCTQVHIDHSTPAEIREDIHLVVIPCYKCSVALQQDPRNSFISTSVFLVGMPGLQAWATVPRFDLSSEDSNSVLTLSWQVPRAPSPDPHYFF